MSPTWMELTPGEQETAVRVLTRKQLEVLQALDRMSQRKLALALGISRAAVREHYDTAVRKLYKELA